MIEDTERKFTCDKCGKEYLFNPNQTDENNLVKSNKCWTIDLGEGGYGSKLDGCHVVIDLCDACLYTLVDSLIYKKGDVVVD